MTQDFDPDELLDQQHKWENKHPDKSTQPVTRCHVRDWMST